MKFRQIDDKNKRFVNNISFYLIKIVFIIMFNISIKFFNQFSKKIINNNYFVYIIEFDINVNVVYLLKKKIFINI